MRIVLSVFAGLLGIGCGQPIETELGRDSAELNTSDVMFGTCTEFAGFGAVPLSNAESAVPEAYDVTAIGSDAQIVVRAVQCDAISVGSSQPKPGTLSQIGITINGGDPTAFVNNYTLWYVTDHAQLHASLRSAGLASVKEPGLSYTVDDQLFVVSDNPKTPPHTASGSVSPPAGTPTAFVATWWEDGRHGTVAARTVFPAITFTFDGSVELTTPEGSELADLIGGTTLTFGGLNSYNSFASAVMTVTPQ